LPPTRPRARALLVGKIGSSFNYFLELCTALALGAGALLAFARERPRAWLAATSALAVQAIAFVLAQRSATADARARMAARDDVARVDAIVRDARDVLADEWAGLLPLAGRAIAFQPFEMARLADAGLWDDRELAAVIRAQRFDAILIYEPSAFFDERWTRALRRAIEDRYAVTQIIARTMVYRPR
jgi:hypothetical protein